jgi:hypothetical protein
MMKRSASRAAPDQSDGCSSPSFCAVNRLDTREITADTPANRHALAGVFSDTHAIIKYGAMPKHMQGVRQIEIKPMLTQLTSFRASCWQPHGED